MRVLFWSEVFWPYIGGAEVLGAKLLPALRERGYAFIVATAHGHLDLPDEARYKDIPVYRFPFCQALATGNIGQIVKIRRQLAELKRAFAPALIHINDFGPGILFHLDTAKAHPAPSLMTLHREWSAQAVGRDRLLRRALNSVDWITGVSAAVLATTRQLMPAVIPHSSLILNGLEVPPLLPAPLPINRPRLLCLGRLVPHKGFDLALAAFASIVTQFPHVRLVVAGDGPARPALERQAAALGVAKLVDFIGFVTPDHVPQLINGATVVLIPSRLEAFSLVALEAALMARPVVATRIGGLSEVVQHQQTGLLIEKEDSQALATAIEFLLHHPDTATRMGQAARGRAREVFSWKRCVDAYDALYRTLARESSSNGSAAIP